MQCVNCRNEINLGGLICPYCHTDPIIFGSQPYSGVSSGGGEVDPYYFRNFYRALLGYRSSSIGFRVVREMDK